MKNVGLLAAFIIVSVFSNAQSISGTVTDEAHRPLPGASITILNAGRGAVSDATGHYSLSAPAAGSYRVEVTAIGYAGVVKPVAISNETVSLDVTLEPAAYRLNEVVVTAQKQEEPGNKLPLSISTLTSRDVTEYRLWNSKDITAIVPNLYSSDPGDRRNVTSIRGIATTSYDPAVATYIDGVNQFNLDTYISPLFDVERVEVLRGPQGTLYGRNAMGGVINIITRQPTNKTEAFAEASIGNHHLQRYTAGVRVPLLKDKIWFGAAGLYERSNGFYTNAFNNKPYDKQESLLGNYYLKFQATKNLSVTLNAKHANNRNNGPFPLTVDPTETFSKPYVLSQNALTHMHDDVFNGSLVAQYRGRHFNLTSQTAYQSNRRIYTAPIDADFSPIDGITLINNYGADWNKVKVYTEELRFTSPANTASPLTWTVGTYLFHQDNPTKQATHFGEDAQYVGSPDKNYSLLNTTNAKSSGAALFAQASYRITKQLQLIGGLRYDYEKKKQSVLGQYQPDGAPEPVFDTRPDTSASTHFSAVSPKLGLSFEATDNQTIFATYSKGYRAGGLTPLASDPSQPPLFAFKPEYSNNYEAGIKNTWLQNRLQLNLTAFYTVVTDVQTPTLVLPDAVTITRNAGRLKSKGAEAELTATVIKGLEIDYSFGYTHATYTDLKVPQNGSEVNLEGKRQLFTPDITSMLAAQYSQPLDKKGNVRLLLRGEWKYLGTQYFDLTNNIRQAPYQLLNTRVGVAFKNVELTFWGRNLTDKKYISYAYDFGAFHLGDPKTYGGTVRLQF